MNLANTIRFIAATTLLTTAGCSTYQRRWQQAAANQPPSAYQGHWTSTKMPGTGGKLWCIITQKNATQLEAEFRATWHGVFASEHKAQLTADRRGRFKGDAKIEMWIGSGTYHCEGRLTLGGMEACYDADYDRGTFSLTRAANRRTLH